MESRLERVSSMDDKELKEIYGDNSEVVKTMVKSTKEYVGNHEAEKAFEIASDRLKVKDIKNSL